MKKILTMLIVVAVLFSAVPFAKAGNPPVNTNNPFPAEYNLSVVKVNNPYMAGFDSYWPTYTCPAPFMMQDGDCVWFLAEKDKREVNGGYSTQYELAKMNIKTGIVKDSYQIEGTLKYWTSILQDNYNYYIMSTVYKKDNNGDERAIKSILYAFSKKTKHIVWKQEFPDVALIPSIETGFLCIINNGILIRDYHLGKLMYFDHDGNKIWENRIVSTFSDGITIVGYNSKKKSVIVEVNGAQHIYEVSIENGKAIESVLKVEGGLASSDKIKVLWYGPFGSGLQDIAKGSTLVYVVDRKYNLPLYTILAYLKYDEKNDEYILKEFKKLNPTLLENVRFQFLCAPWFYDIRPLGSGRYLYYDLPRIPYHLTSMYAIMYNKDFSKKIWTIRVGKTNVKVNGKTVTYIPINTFRIYDMPEYGKTLIYADKNKVVFADPDTAVPKAEFTLPAPHLTAKEGQTLGEIVMPLGVSDGNLYVSLIEQVTDGKTGKAVKVETYIAKLSYEEAHLTINSSVPGLRFTISKDGKKYVVEEGKEVSLMPGTYTVSIDGVGTKYLKLPEPVAVTLKNGDSKTVTLNYIRVYEMKLTIESKTFTVNGKRETLDSPPVIIPEWGRTVVPIRAIVEALGGTVSWNPENREVDVALGDKTVSLWIGKNQAKVGWMFKPIDKDPNVKPIIINGRTMLPLRFVAESLGCSVDWDPATKTITITYTSSQ